MFCYTGYRCYSNADLFISNLKGFIALKLFIVFEMFSEASLKANLAKKNDRFIQSFCVTHVCNVLHRFSQNAIPGVCMYLVSDISRSFWDKFMKLSGNVCYPMFYEMNGKNC